MIFEDDNDMEENLSHKSYKEYKKELEGDKKPNENLIIFVSVFFVMLLFFLGLAKHLSPDVDVNISGNEEQTEQNNDSDVENHGIDERLKDLQMEDKVVKTDETFSTELEEKVVLPEKQRRTVGENPINETKQEIDTNKQVKNDKASQTYTEPVTTTVNAKVVVGYYTTKEQAEVAKGIIEDAGLNLHPFVKNTGNAFTLQVGSFNTREKAQNAVNELLRNNFPARIIIE